MTMCDSALGYTVRGVEVFPLRGKMPAISKEDGGRGFSMPPPTPIVFNR